jgi:hypothetical protein
MKTNNDIIKEFERLFDVNRCKPQETLLMTDRYYEDDEEESFLEYAEPKYTPDENKIKQFILQSLELKDQEWREKIESIRPSIKDLPAFHKVDKEKLLEFSWAITNAKIDKLLKEII